MILVDVVYVRPGLAADLKKVSEPPRCHHSNASELSLDQRVRPDCCAMREAGNIRCGNISGEVGDAGNDGCRRILRRRKPFAEKGFAGITVNGYQIRKSAADVDAHKPGQAVSLS